jgi:hypothetical protein
MLNKNLLFIFFSILLGFIISYYYNQKFNTEFILYFVLISLILYILFYFLGQDQTKENFGNNSLDDEQEEEGRMFNAPIRRMLQEQEEEEGRRFNAPIRRMLQEQEEEEGRRFNAPIRRMLQEEESKTTTSQMLQEQEEEEGRRFNAPIRRMLQEEGRRFNAPIRRMLQEEESKMATSQMWQEQEEMAPSQSADNIIEEELMGVSTTTLPLNTPYGPLNINISYNSQNSVNEVGGTKCTNSTNGGGSNTPTSTPPPPPNNNIGNNLCSNSRVYNNSDWIYGSYAWTNDPDYYIPSEDTNCNKPSYPVPLNELITTRKFRKENDVCPLMVNTPWTEYKTGDSEPEPYNL